MHHAPYLAFDPASGHHIPPMPPPGGYEHYQGMPPHPGYGPGYMQGAPPPPSPWGRYPVDAGYPPPHPAMPGLMPGRGHPPPMMHRLSQDAYREDSSGRWVLEPEDVVLLERVFALQKCPGRELRAQLAARLRVKPRQVQVWFQNKRQRTKNGAKPTMAETIAINMQKDPESDAGGEGDDGSAEALVNMAASAAGEGTEDGEDEEDDEDDDSPLAQVPDGQGGGDGGDEGGGDGSGANASQATGAPASASPVNASAAAPATAAADAAPKAPGASADATNRKRSAEGGERVANVRVKPTKERADEEPWQTPARLAAEAKAAAMALTMPEGYPHRDYYGLAGGSCMHPGAYHHRHPHMPPMHYPPAHAPPPPHHMAVADGYTDGSMLWMRSDLFATRPEVRSSTRAHTPAVHPARARPMLHVHARRLHASAGEPRLPSHMHPSTSSVPPPRAPLPAKSFSARLLTPHTGSSTTSSLLRSPPPPCRGLSLCDRRA